MRLTQKAVTAGLAAVISAGSLAATAVPASAADTVLPVANASFEAGFTDSKVTCWNVTPTAKLTVTKNAHSGAWAGYVAGLSPAGTQLELTTDRTTACRTAVTAGRSYTLNMWQRSTAGVTPVVYAYSSTAGWNRWFTGSVLPATATLHGDAVKLPVVPAGVSAVSVGLAFAGTSTVVLDDVTLSSAAVVAAPVVTAPTGTSLFRAVFPTTARLVTNEFAYWSPNNTSRIVSPDWEMTSGSLFARNGGGYTGGIDNRSPNATSTTGTNSAVFRLNTRNHSFRDVNVSMNLNIAGLTSTSSTPKVAWDGVHIFLHYQTQYELYYASVARRDGHVVIKKKCKGGPSNGGSYYVLGNSELTGKAFPYGTSMQVGASVRTNANGSVTIVLFRDGKAVTSATDTGVGCAPITNAGATGIRGDNAEFDFNNFSVTPLV